jgi:hypothetical protein
MVGENPTAESVTIERRWAIERIGKPCDGMHATRRLIGLLFWFERGDANPR